MESAWSEFQKNHAEEHRLLFMDLQKSLWTSMVALFPETTEFKHFLAQVTFFGSTPVTSSKFLDEWYSNMSADASDVSYAKPFRRLTGRKLTYFDVTKYKDYKSLLSVPVLRENIDVDLVEVFETPSFEPERKFLFCVLQELNELACRAKADVSYDSVPSRDEISAEIKQSKTKNGGPKGDIEMTAGLLSEVFAVMQSSVTQPSAKSLGELVKRLKACDLDKDWDIQSLHTSLSAIDMESDDALEKILTVDHPLMARADVRGAIEGTDNPGKLRSAFGQFVSFNRVAGTISSGLLKAVKDELGDVSNYTNADGSVDLSKVDIMSMMPRLMQNVDPNELQDMAQNLGSMMPELQKMAQASNLGGSSDKLPQGMDLGALSSMMGALGGAQAQGAPDMGSLAAMLGKMQTTG